VRAIAAAAALSALAALAPQAAIAEAARDVSLAPFASLQVDTAMSVRVVCGEAYGLRVFADPPSIGERYLDIAAEGGALRLHFRRDFDRHVHPDQVRIEATVAAPLTRLTATTGARVTLSPCALAPEGFSVRAETGARVELSGRIGLVEIALASGASLNALSAGRGFFAERVRLEAGARTRAGLCGAGRVEIASRAADATVLTGC
jgi:hypothetical protein